MQQVSLCDPDCEDVVLPALPARGSPRRNDAGPHPDLRVRTEESAYLTLEECDELVDATLAHLRRLLEAKGPIFGTRFPTRVPLSWMKSTAKHGVCKSTPLPTELGMKQRWSFEIEFSRPVFEHTTRQGRVQTVIHETCHVVATLLGGRGHDTIWQRCMRACGVPADTRAGAVSGVDIMLHCPKCARNCSVSPATAAKMEAGASMVCPTCGTYLKSDNLEVPEHMKKRVKTQKARVRTYTCQKCGLVIPLRPKHLTALARGAKLGCSGCGTMLDPARIEQRLGDLPKAP